ncbi:hypothetical protein HN511_01240 [bacterium]|nr:hypothetical protein [bacterium]
MKVKVLKQEEIKESIPHRFENILLDKCEVTKTVEEIEGKIEITINEKDHLGREIFLKQKNTKQRVVMEPFFMEILALGSIVSTGKISEGRVALFAAVSNFKKHRDMLVNEKVSGTVRKIKAKGDFLKYGGELTNAQNQVIASGEMMAFYTKMEDLETVVEKNTVLTWPTAKKAINKENVNKAPEMFLIDNLVSLDEDSLEICGDYTYPKTHTLIKGHFPGNPIMMGVMQWMAIADLTYVLAAYLAQKGTKGRYQIKADAEIVKENGVAVAQARGIILQVYWQDSVFFDQVEIIETKKIFFKGMVKPGDKIFIKLSKLELLKNS